jgi:DNA-binding MarR family transcriptional regulator
MPDFDLQKFLPYRLSVVAEQVSHAFAERYASQFHLTIPEWRVIAHLGSAASLSLTEIGQRTEMDKVKVHRAVARLVASRQVKRKISNEDRRIVLLSLSATGRTVYEKIVPLALHLENELIAGFNQKEYEQLTSLLAKLEQRIAGISSAGRI